MTSSSMWGGQGGQDPASRWLQQQGQMRPAQAQQPQGRIQAQQGAYTQAPGMAANQQGRMQGGAAMTQSPYGQHPAVAQPMPHPMQAPQPWGQHPAMQAQMMPHAMQAPQQSWMANQGGAQGAIHPAMQHALDQQAHLQSQLGAMRVQPQAVSPYAQRPAMPQQTMGPSPWGRR